MILISALIELITRPRAKQRETAGRRGYGRPRAADGFRGRAHRRPRRPERPSGQRSSEYDIQINIILFIPEFCKKSIFTKNRISPKNECIFPENPRNFSLHRQKTALFFGKCSVFFHFFRKNIDFRVSTSRKRITFAPEEQNTLCRGSKSESLRCCFFRF